MTDTDLILEDFPSSLSMTKNDIDQFSCETVYLLLTLPITFQLL